MFIQVENIDFSYTPGTPVLRDVSFDLGKGETLAVVGASGCGKSTLLRIIAGILPQPGLHKLDGEVVINGRTADEYRRSGKLAFMFQEATLMPNLTVRDNIAFPLKIKGLRNDERINELIEAVGLSDFASYLPKHLSGGMKTRVALARSFVTGPELLLMDEPFAALDIAWKSKLYIELEVLAAQFATTVVFVTHDVQESLLLSDRLVVLGRFGKIIHKIIVDSEAKPTLRVQDISKYVGSSTYQANFVEVQKQIMTDGIRQVVGNAEVDRILDRINRYSRNGSGAWPTFYQDTVSIRDYSNRREVYELLLIAFRKSSSMEFKNGLIWDITNFDGITDDARRQIRDFYLSNIETIARQSQTGHYSVPEDRLFDYLVDTRINGNRDEYPKQKLFLYLCDLYASSETHRVLNYLDDVANGKYEDLDDSFTKETAEIVRRKIEANSKEKVRAS